jgi:hypothetical protein
MSYTRNQFCAGPELQMDMARVLASRALRAHTPRTAGKGGPVACSYRDQTDPFGKVDERLMWQ